MGGKNRAFDYDTARFALWCDPSEVMPYEKNAKLHDEKQVNIIANSIKQFGWQQDCVVTRDKVLVIGHGRRLAAIQLGCKMPYHMVDKTADELTEADIKALLLADNKTAESGWDLDFLSTELEDIGAEIDMTEFGFADPEEIDWSRVEDLNDDSYEEPEHEMLECPYCHHVDRKIHFKKVDKKPSGTDDDGE